MTVGYDGEGILHLPFPGGKTPGVLKASAGDLERVLEESWTSGSLLVRFWKSSQISRQAQIH